MAAHDATEDWRHRYETTRARCETLQGLLDERNRLLAAQQEATQRALARAEKAEAELAKCQTSNASWR